MGTERLERVLQEAATGTNGKVFTGRLGKRPANVLFDRICLNNGIRHILTAPYSPTTTGKVERLHKTMRKEFFSDNSFDTIDDMQAALDAWVLDYNNEREHQALGDVPPIRRFELARPSSLEVIDGEVAMEEEPVPAKKVVSRRVDRAGRISLLKHRYHVGRHLAVKRSPSSRLMGCCTSPTTASWSRPTRADTWLMTTTRWTGAQNPTDPLRRRKVEKSFGRSIRTDR